MILFIPTTAILVAAAMMDLQTEKISNWLILAGLAGGWILQLILKFPNGIPDVIAGTLVPIVLFWIAFRMHGLGAGDIKLLAVVGCMNGFRVFLICMLFTCLVGAVFALVILLYHRQTKLAFRELFYYFQRILVEKKITVYPASADEERKMHFSLAILYGYLLTGVSFFFYGLSAFSTYYRFLDWLW